MKLLTDIDDIDISVHDIVMNIDGIMHEEITDKTGITVNHRDIQKFVVGIINENNYKQRKIRLQQEELRRDIKKFDVIYRDKVKKGKVLYGLNSIKDIIRFYIFGYIILHPTGCTYNQEFLKCEDCRYDFNGEECVHFRKDNNALLSCDHKKFI